MPVLRKTYVSCCRIWIQQFLVSFKKYYWRKVLFSYVKGLEFETDQIQCRFLQMPFLILPVMFAKVKAVKVKCVWGGGAEAHYSLSTLEAFVAVVAIIIRNRFFLLLQFV
jgi:hypothetical protein